MNRVKMNEAMMAQVNGGKSTTSVVNPYSPNAPIPRMGEKKNENAK